MKQKTKKKRVPRAQSRLALARFRQQQREQRQQTAARRVEQRWNKTLRQLAELGATLQQHEEDGLRGHLRGQELSLSLALWGAALTQTGTGTPGRRADELGRAARPVDDRAQC